MKPTPITTHLHSGGRIETYALPGCILQEVDQNGHVWYQSEPNANVTVDLHYGPASTHPRAAELNDDGELGADIGLWWEGNALCDYDGVFDVPKPVAELLTALGFNMDYLLDT